MLREKINPAAHKGDWELGARLGVVILSGVISLVFTDMAFVHR